MRPHLSCLHNVWAVASFSAASAFVLAARASYVIQTTAIQEVNCSCRLNPSDGTTRKCTVSISLPFVLQTLYKTQVRELKEECEEKNKLYKEVQQSLQDQQEER